MTTEDITARTANDAQAQLKVVDGEDLSIFDWTGAGIALLGMGVIVFGWTAKE